VPELLARLAEQEWTGFGDRNVTVSAGVVHFVPGVVPPPGGNADGRLVGMLSEADLMVLHRGGWWHRRDTTWRASRGPFGCLCYANVTDPSVAPT